MKYRVIIIVGVVLILFIALIALLFGRKSGGGIVGEIEFWSFEEPSVWQEVVNAFEDQNKKTNVTYVKKDPVTYEAELLNALAAGRGPDVFVINHLWLSKHADKLAPFNPELISTSDFQTIFVDVAKKDLVLNNFVYALPLYIDTLALYYNRDVFNSSGIALPPKTWEQLNDTVKILTQQEKETGTILLAGAGIGTSNNITHASDILSLLMIQSGTPMIDERNNEAVFNQDVLLDGKSFNPGEAALEYYTSFSDPGNNVYTWNRRQDNDLKAYLTGKSAIYLGYARDLEVIEKSGINFGISSLPQVKDRLQDLSYIDVNYANYWAGSINKQSLNASTGQAFLLFATSRNSQFNYLSKAGLPTSRRDLVDFQPSNKNLGVFTAQSLTASSWRQPDEVQVKQIFVSMIEDVILGRANIKEAIKNAVGAVNNIK